MNGWGYVRKLIKKDIYQFLYTIYKDMQWYHVSCLQTYEIEILKLILSYIYVQLELDDISPLPEILDENDNEYSALSGRQRACYSASLSHSKNTQNIGGAFHEMADFIDNYRVSTEQPLSNVELRAIKTMINAAVKTNFKSKDQ
jgi:hypothetical protein